MDTDDAAARRPRAARFATMPIVLAGTIAVAAGLTGPVAAGHLDQRHRPEEKHEGDHTRRAAPDRVETDHPVFGTAVATSTPTVTTVAAITEAPASYTVVQGDTVSAIAARYGLSPRDVLSANGLSWNAIIHPGQTLTLRSGSTATGRTGGTSTYHVVSGDTATGIAARLGVSTNALLAANQLSASSVIYPGQTLRVPSATTTSTVAVTTNAGTSTAAPAVSRATTVHIHAGDTLATIASAHAVSVADLLAANGLTYTSTIYAGSTLVVPASSGVGLTNEMRANAETIVRVGRALGVPERGLVVALAAAMQESGLRDLDHGDRDSIGLFQQRPSQGWGSASELMDPTYAARLFFGGPHNPNAGTTAGLLDVPGWQSMSVTDAAQAVQNSAYPKAYGQWEKPATAWLATL
ncbi:LysM peptidoglycan-binding domain-containing protein [Curtobacterium sp. MCBD17_003]|uniref:LysM peptidoglycan-binding domain-containing protein n=1 Tax=Curtobacterium sp. MCBD17_003 TaxID=2175667 RepID=UPI0011B490A1|nr:LysM peptidoglycan-binding domain-containing protein [Curtobacterium sp. MCBD17_003]WIE55795.1 LysM peptidoglycan-binding domain-containing protein [Curtobacterium sp. MCBD17_003]